MNSRVVAAIGELSGPGPMAYLAAFVLRLAAAELHAGRARADLLRAADELEEHELAVLMRNMGEALTRRGGRAWELETEADLWALLDEALPTTPTP